MKRPPTCDPLTCWVCAVINRAQLHRALAAIPAEHRRQVVGDALDYMESDEARTVTVTVELGGFRYAVTEVRK